MWRWILVGLSATSLFSDISLDRMMTYPEMRKTGVYTLSYSQKKALEEWINTNFEPKVSATTQQQKQITLSLNIDNGAKLEFSDGSVYEINPDDRIYTAYWITPFPVLIGKSDNPNYPVKITDLTSNTSVSAKQISSQELFQEKNRRMAPKAQPSQKTKKST